MPRTNNSNIKSKQTVYQNYLHEVYVSDRVQKVYLFYLVKLNSNMLQLNAYARVVILKICSYLLLLALIHNRMFDINLLTVIKFV